MAVLDVKTCCVCGLAEIEDQVVNLSQECLRLKVREDDRIFLLEICRF